MDIYGALLVFGGLYFVALIIYGLISNAGKIQEAGKKAFSENGKLAGISSLMVLVLLFIVMIAVNM